MIIYVLAIQLFITCRINYHSTIIQEEKFQQHVNISEKQNLFSEMHIWTSDYSIFFIHYPLFF